MDFVGSSPTAEELQAVKSVIAGVIIAMRNYGLYPETHLICKKSIANVQARLVGFLNEHDHLRLDVEKDRLVFKEEVVYQGVSEEKSLAFWLFRDGIQWLELQKGLDIEEVRGFFTILNRYARMKEESEGDLVTALWEMNFPHLRYQATDLYWDAEPLVDFSLLSASGEDQHSLDQFLEEDNLSVSVAVPDMGRALWKLTPSEMNEIRRMIVEEEKRDGAEDVLDVVTVLLKNESEKENFSAVLEFLAEEFQDALGQGEFRFTSELLKKLMEVRRTGVTDKSWAGPLLDRFFLDISSSSVLGGLEQVWPVFNTLNSEEIKWLRETFYFLPSEAILALGPMLTQIQTFGAQRQLMQIIVTLARRNLAPLERLLKHPNEDLVQRLILILGHIKEDKVTELLFQMLGHPSGGIRMQTLKVLFAMDFQLLEKIFHLVEDESDAIRLLMLEGMGRRRDDRAERLLLDYLEKKRFQRTDRDHLLGCYRALGRCGSSRSVPFLRRTLFGRFWGLGLGNTVHREGALVALYGIRTLTAGSILEKASRSLSPVVWYAYRRATHMNRMETLR